MKKFTEMGDWRSEKSNFIMTDQKVSVSTLQIGLPERR